jgi:hypothetical protein
VRLELFGDDVTLRDERFFFFAIAWKL